MYENSKSYFNSIQYFFYTNTPSHRISRKKRKHSPLKIANYALTIGTLEKKGYTMF